MSQITSKIKLSDIAYMDDEKFMRVLFSSADYFPGLYRYTLGTLPFPYDNLNHQQLFTAFMQQQHYGKCWNHLEWFTRQDEIHSQTMIISKSRNKERDDEALAEELENRAYRRYVSPSLFALAAMDIQSPVTELIPGFTYLMMGSHIRFEQDEFYVGYDDLTETWTHKIEIPYYEVWNYINEIMSEQDIEKLFISSSVIAHLSFDGPKGTIVTTLEHLSSWTEFSAPVFAAPIEYTPPMPIRFAKPIGVSNVTAD